MGVMYKIHQDMKRERVRTIYEQKHRLIDQAVYIKLKTKKKCMRCKKKLNGRIPEIHHIKPKCKGGTDDEKNLLALCTKCHKILDAEQGVGNGKDV